MSFQLTQRVGYSKETIKLRPRLKTNSKAPKLFLSGIFQVDDMFLVCAMCHIEADHHKHILNIMIKFKMPQIAVLLNTGRYLTQGPHLLDVK